MVLLPADLRWPCVVSRCMGDGDGGGDKQGDGVEVAHPAGRS